MTESDDIRPWDRQPGESSKAYEAFCVYRDAGTERTQLLVENALGKSKALVSRWAGAHDWVARSRAWDSMPARAVQGAYEEMARDIAAQHRALSDKLMARLSRNLDLLPEGQDPTIKWSTAQAAAHRGHSFAADLSKPKDTAREDITKKIAETLAKLAGDE